LPEIDVDAFIMERILNSSANHIKQIIYRGFNTTMSVTGESTDILFDSFLIKLIILDSRTSTINDNEYLNKKDLSSIKNTNLNLERLWNYSSHLTHDRNVSCLCWNQQNHVR